MFPLHTVLFPGVHLPLHIFEPRYRQLTIDLVTEVLPGKLFGVVAVRTSVVREVDKLEHVHTIGCSARLREAQRLPDGRFDIITTGHRRFRLCDIDSNTAPYLMGTVDWVDDDPLPAAASKAAARLGDAAKAAHRRYCSSAWEGDSWRTPDDDVPPAELAYLLAADCLLPLADRQALLAERQPLRRLHTVYQLLTREAGFLSELGAVPTPHGEMDDVSLDSNLN